MPDRFSSLVSEVLASPLGDVIASVGEGVAAAQRALDEASVAKTLEIYSEGGEELIQLMREIGYRPTFYALPETIGEVNVSMRLSSEVGAAPPLPAAAAPVPGRPLARLTPTTASRVKTYVTPVDAGFANRYNFTATASAKLTFKIVPVPPPAGVEDVRVVPDLTGRTVAVARDVLDALGLEGSFVGVNGQAATPEESATVKSTDPGKNAVVQLGATIRMVV
ncbi:MAG TPA: PASTA domain-containing protein [Allosphingosinicella sp.]